jgi:hypothetical protein
VFDTVNGLPAHPLLAHVVIVFVPLTALIAVLVVLWPAARRRIGGAALFVAIGTLVAIPVTTVSGDWLLHHLMMASAITRRHAALGGQLRSWFTLLTISMVFWWALHTRRVADEVATLPQAAGRILTVLAGVDTLLFAVLSTWSVVVIGHTGAQAVWGGMGC